MNELANLAEVVGADIDEVRRGIGSDSRIGYHFLYPGVGYGGSCFPKDIKALQRTAADAGRPLKLVGSVEDVNNAQKHVLSGKIRARFGDNLKGRTFALWGLAFKPNTDDMREAPSLVLISELLAAGAAVRAYDPAARDEAAKRLKGEARVRIVDSAEAALEDADALVIVTEWREFRSPDFKALRARLKTPVIFDGRNLYEPEFVAREGLEYFPIGRNSGRSAGGKS
jgi:UDPglucose 6-dehydrogenase